MPRSSRTNAATLAAIVLLAGPVARRTCRRLRRYEIAEESMVPALAPGDYVVATRLAEPPLRGDVVVFTHPHRPGFELVKRVVGLPGEEVAIAAGQVTVDGGLLPEPWADGPTRPDGRWVLGDGELFVLGDGRTRSIDDGRTLGPLPAKALRWRVVLRYWPLRRIGLL